MLASEFVDKLIILFGSPESDDPEALIAEYVNSLKTIKPTVLAATYEIVKRTHTRRSWPTIGQILQASSKAIADAGVGTVPGDWRRLMPKVPMADYDEATKERWRKAEEFQKAMADKYGTFDAYLTATAHLRTDGSGKPRMASRRSTATALSEVSQRITGELRDVSRPAFEEMQRNSPNAGLHARKP